MRLRAYHSSDCQHLVRLFHETVHTVNVQGYTPEQLDAWAPGSVDLDAWNRSFREHHTVVAVEGDMIVGFGDIDATGYLDRLFTHKDHQGQGIATAVCDELKRAAGGLPIRVRASVTARPFFERRGYAVVGKRLAMRGGAARK